MYSYESIYNLLNYFYYFLLGSLEDPIPSQPVTVIWFYLPSFFCDIAIARQLL